MPVKACHHGNARLPNAYADRLEQNDRSQEPPPPAWTCSMPGGLAPPQQRRSQRRRSQRSHCQRSNWSRRCRRSGRTCRSLDQGCRSCRKPQNFGSISATTQKMFIISHQCSFVSRPRMQNSGLCKYWKKLLRHGTSVNNDIPQNRNLQKGNG